MRTILILAIAVALGACSTDGITGPAADAGSFYAAATHASPMGGERPYVASDVRIEVDTVGWTGAQWVLVWDLFGSGTTETVRRCPLPLSVSSSVPLRALTMSVNGSAPEYRWAGHGDARIWSMREFVEVAPIIHVRIEHPASGSSAEIAWGCT